MRYGVRVTDIHPWLIAAALAAFATCLIHILLGGRQFVQPLLGAELQSVVKHTHYYCWHLVSASLALMAAAFAWAAFAPDARAAAFVATALAGLFFAVNVVQNVSMRLSFARHPQWIFFSVVTLLGVAGLAYG